MRIIIDIEGLTATATTEVAGKQIMWGCTNTDYGTWSWDIGTPLDSDNDDYMEVLDSYQVKVLDEISLPNLQSAFGDEYTEEEEDEQEYYDEVNDTVYTKEDINA